MQHWLLVRGRGEKPLAAAVRTNEIRAHSSSKRPSVQEGELAILYAAVWQAVFGVVEITGPPENDPERTRWAWRFPIRPLLAVRDLHDAPPVEAAGVFPNSIWRHSHIRLTPEQFASARALIEAASALSDEHEIVRHGYDAIADRYAAWAASFESPAMRWLERLLTVLPDGSDVLELGCGGGGPSTLAIAARHRLVGVDISAEQIARARQRVPNAEFIQADATKLELTGTFDAVVSLFMLGHVRRSAQEPLLRKIHSWLRPGGWFLGTMGTADADDVVEDDWLGAPMFFASFDEQTNRELLERTGFLIEDARVVPFEEPGHGLVRFMWVLARRPG